MEFSVYLGGLGRILGILSGTELLHVLANVTRAFSNIEVGNKLVKILFYVIYSFKIQAYYMIKMSISCLQIKWIVLSGEKVVFIQTFYSYTFCDCTTLKTDIFA